MPTVIDNPLPALRERYENLYGKRAFRGWKEDKLREMIDAHESNTGFTHELPKWEQVKHTYTEDKGKPCMVFNRGKAYAIIDNKYVPYGMARVMYRRIKIQEETEAIEEVIENMSDEEREQMASIEADLLSNL